MTVVKQVEGGSARGWTVQPFERESVVVAKYVITQQKRRIVSQGNQQISQLKLKLRVQGKDGIGKLSCELRV